MVAEKNGIIRFYDLVSQQPIMSLSTEQLPLISADWCKANALKVGAVARDDWLIWDMSKSRYVCQIGFHFTRLIMFNASYEYILSLDLLSKILIAILTTDSGFNNFFHEQLIKWAKCHKVKPKHKNLQADTPQ